MRLIQVGLILLSLLLTACVYHPPIEQGNLLTPQKTEQVKRGMSMAQVINIMGSPVIKDLYHDGKVAYIYTYTQKDEIVARNRFIVIFSRGKVVQTKTDMPTLPKV